MMKIYKIAISILMLAASPLLIAKSSEYSAESTPTKGFQTFGNEKIRSVKTDGSVTLNGTTVEDFVEVHGKLYADGAHIGSVNAGGHVSLINTIVEHGTTVNGAISADHCELKDTTSVSALNPTFKHCKLDTLHVRKVLGTSVVQVVELKDGTVVKGNISFDSKNGKVIVSSDSEIQGNVEGATVTYQNH